jgi:nucleoside-diphosphate-sugar epimerase
MRILFTGASSFSGFWFVKELALRGHEVVAILRKNPSEYEGVRRSRIALLQEICLLRSPISYGSEEFLKLIQEERFDLFCHHAADVTDYKSPYFDPVKALANNTGPIQNFLKILRECGCNKILLTGSVFEPSEGLGSDGLRAVSPYGLSKGLTSDFFRFYCEVNGCGLGKFVIPNPFGPYEEFRFTSFLMQNWFENKPVHVSSPAYVRDNIHISLLAKAYAQFAGQLQSGFQKINPSGYPESQGAFTERFAKEMRRRLSLLCEFTLAKRQEFPEPKVRINSDVLDHESLGWDEEAAWDQLAEYYESQFSQALIT